MSSNCKHQSKNFLDSVLRDLSLRRKTPCTFSSCNTNFTRFSQNTFIELQVCRFFSNSDKYFHTFCNWYIPPQPANNTKCHSLVSVAKNVRHNSFSDSTSVVLSRPLLSFSRTVLKTVGKIDVLT